MQTTHYFLKLVPCRPTFAQDMTPEERAIMHRHAAYLKDLANKGVIIVFGPVFDPNAAYGMAVVNAENEEQVKTIIANDPASAINTYEFYPMVAVVKE
ncbi:MAG: hypothetical protein JWP44_3258 [Mucilaginibacter sp.]|jgi:uncharacterized protein YciI|nr:hypothetical protein [Mucilaginibacter sp.]